MNTIRFVLGDWSDDGHGKTSDELISCNRTVEELKEAFLKGCDIIGIKADPSSGCMYFADVASEYEDDNLPDILVEYFDLADYIDDPAGGFRVTGWLEGQEILLPKWKEEAYQHKSTSPYKVFGIPYIVLWFAVACEGDPEIEAAVVTDDMPFLNIGGYGLFY